MTGQVDVGNAAAALEALYLFREHSDTATADVGDALVWLAGQARTSVREDVQAMVWQAALTRGVTDDALLRDLCGEHLATLRRQAWDWASSSSTGDATALRQLASALLADDVDQLTAMLKQTPAVASRAEALLRNVDDENARSTLRDRAAADFRLVPSGWSLMGGGTKADQLPVIRVWLPSYYVARFPVTVAEWRVFAGRSGRGAQVSGENNWPAGGLSWRDAADYAAYRGLRLLTEVEWERAARGPAGHTYPWGDEFQPGRANTIEAGLGRFTAVDAYATAGDSGFGVTDMVGNAWEWTSSTYSGYAGQTKGADHRRLDDTADRVLRGGAYDFDASWCTALNRYRCPPARGWDTHGMRLGN